MDRERLSIIRVIVRMHELYFCSKNTHHTSLKACDATSQPPTPCVPPKTRVPRRQTNRDGGISFNLNKNNMMMEQKLWWSTKGRQQNYQMVPRAWNDEKWKMKKTAFWSWSEQQQRLRWWIIKNRLNETRLKRFSFLLLLDALLVHSISRAARVCGGRLHAWNRKFHTRV